ncbi:MULTISPECIES: DUF3703 domain-containing protein [unclassified Sphingomonas]|jgi:hypothetical protein|uniref:DUF3703 domain-containing protein n=1 Tax=unclassified Sphingomonas TaxID=196159 RepID=UPI000A9D0649|nr:MULTISPECIES: DUF3703 domain-containing protein [unclassified Sphingomonas]
MKVSRSTHIALKPETVWAEVQKAGLLQHIAWPLVRFIPIDDAAFESFRPGGRYEVKLRLFGIIPFGTQWIVTSTHDADGTDWPKRLRDNGHSALISRWDHWITVMPEPNGGTHYSDEVEVSAGALTPFIWAFAQIFYWHRQRRWRGLANSFTARRVIAAEMAAYRSAVKAGDDDRAWHHLERVHIVSQPYLGPHLASHGAMLGFAIRRRDWSEVMGQIVRIILAPIGAVTGRLPVGNTGRSNVSAFAPMPVPDDLQLEIDQPDQGSR